MNRTVLALFLVCFAGMLRAGTPDDYTFTVLPASPAAGQPFAIRVNVAPASCHPLQPLFPVSPQASNVIRLEVIISDTCTPDLPAQERTYEIAPLAGGVYTFRYAFCGATVFGYTCTTIRDTPVTVLSAAAPMSPRVVPAWSAVGMATTIALVVLAAFAGFAEIRVQPR